VSRFQSFKGIVVPSS